MAIGSKELSVENLEGFDNARLGEELKNAKKELFNLRFQSATGQLEQHGRISVVKRDIARIYTILRERELGIREEVVAKVEETKKATKKKSTKKAEETPAEDAE
ncbi:50S ribosomal protein L29 [Galactobacter caseinivorans]|uniref:Large ribosomal subunit protein uL29 n=1 Tax=Galactobacter caseinivorans TaxID=2676123 RepID=A0A496PLX8_9MICC|nr:50S ribosomal protein L29 [Galactobacter caseinivorans]RKW71476.1 50S ribosomal protein L29 [Galactobacter caseinivorans]